MRSRRSVPCPASRKKLPEDAWFLLTKRLFCEKTSLVYDSLSSLRPEKRFEHLPFPEEIVRHVPNPAGWGTGMEDCMLNAGSVLEICILRARVELEQQQETLSFARRILDGMEACATVHGRPGFVARGISPRDGKSCYINSSRDQFTLFVYGLWRFFHCEFAGEGERDRIRRLLTQVADYCEQVVRPENENNLLRLDGLPGMVSQMIDVAPHEEFRLPMFYLAAWDVSRKEKYRELYERHADRALEVTRSLDPARQWWNLELVQMQISLALAAEADPEQGRKNVIRETMRLVASLAEQAFYREEEKMRKFRGSWSQVTDPWNLVWKMTLRPETIHSDAPSLYHGLLYLKPWENRRFLEAFERMRAVGNLAVAVLLCPEYLPGSDFGERFLQVAEKPDYRNHTSGGVCNILHGYYLLMNRKSGH